MQRSVCVPKALNVRRSNLVFGHFPCTSSPCNDTTTQPANLQFMTCLSSPLTLLDWTECISKWQFLQTTKMEINGNHCWHDRFGNILFLRAICYSCFQIRFFIGKQKKYLHSQHRKVAEEICDRLHGTVCKYNAQFGNSAVFWWTTSFKVLDHHKVHHQLKNMQT